MKWRSILLAAAAVLMLGAAAFAAEGGGQLDDCLHMRIGDVTANPGEDIMVPVYLSDVTGWGVMAFEIEICWCDIPAGLIQYMTCKPGTLLANANGWSPLTCGSCGPNCISVAAAGVNPLEGSGVLFYLQFHVSANAKPCMCCDVWFTSIALYDPEKPLNVCSDDGKVCIEHCDIYGRVTAWFCDYDCDEMYFFFPLQGARVHLSKCGDPVATTYTDHDGRFEFECLEPHDGQALGGGECGYCVDIDYCRMPDGAITAFDAALILQHLVCRDDLDCCYWYNCGQDIYPQQIAADVNCTGVITAYDASLILQYIVGLLPAFPCPDPWVWIYLDCSSCTMSCPGFFDIVGIYKGDVSGFCYRQDGAALTAASQIEVGVPQHHNGYVDIPVLVKGTENISAVQFDMKFNHAALEFDSVRPAGLTQGFMASGNVTGGVLKVAMAGSEAFSGNGRVAVVRFLRKGGPIPATSSRVSLTYALLNETEPVIFGPSQDGIVGFALGPISPNPTNQGTVINFSAPKASHVSLAIYNVNGQLVRTVHEGQVESGTHQFAWDGTDSNGQRVARGVYFCRMNADEFSATEKVVLLQ